MVWYTLVCASCTRKVVIRDGDLDDLQQKYQQINCPVEHCAGQMTVNRRPIKRQKTADKTPDYLRMLNRQKLKRTHLQAVNYADDADDSDDEYGRTSAKRRRVQDDDEDEYVPTPEFNPAMRLSDDGVFCPRGLVAPTLAAANSLHVITAKIPGEREKSTNKAMGDVPAWKHALQHGATNANRYKLGKQNYYEWCHLIGDALGGRCAKENLVAGHYAVNTHMLAIEEVLVGRTDLAIHVEAVCLFPQVADSVIYRIYKNSSQKLLHTEVIDGHSTGVSRSDYDGVVRRIKKSCG